ncbi:unnamed protein product [Allacma fusca]|uniref:Uncharacterized protein n=1 Tax=Allacma fusca TaxID=39272 RepID=A0A8J2KFU0_9HEXA|nr:unnamed protein product [Allacma fusca]
MDCGPKRGALGVYLSAADLKCLNKCKRRRFTPLNWKKRENKSKKEKGLPYRILYGRRAGTCVPSIAPLSGTHCNLSLLHPKFSTEITTHKMDIGFRKGVCVASDLELDGTHFFEGETLGTDLQDKQLRKTQ